MLHPTVGEPVVYDDLAVLGVNDECLNPLWSILTDLRVPGCNYSQNQDNNSSADPDFVFEYSNGGRGTTRLPGEPTTAITVPAAFDEGGNFIQIRFGPLTQGDSDYHILPASLAVDAGTVSTGLFANWDYDNEDRPSGDGVDIGADEVQVQQP